VRVSASDLECDAGIQLSPHPSSHFKSCEKIFFEVAKLKLRETKGPHTPYHI
jgi:hypothetical protein